MKIDNLAIEKHYNIKLKEEINSVCSLSKPKNNSVCFAIKISKDIIELINSKKSMLILVN